MALKKKTFIAHQIQILMRRPERVRSCELVMRGKGREQEMLQLPQGAPSPTEKVNMLLNPLYCSLTHEYTQPGVDILDKEANEVERLL